MSYDLKPRNKKAGTFEMGAFSWPWMLDQGVGLIIGYGTGICGDYISISREVRAGGKTFKVDPCDNDGFPVTGNEARMMARAAYYLAKVWRHINGVWAKMNEEERARRLKANQETVGMELYREPVREDFIEKVEAFSKWAYKSGGFSVS